MVIPKTWGRRMAGETDTVANVCASGGVMTLLAIEKQGRIRIGSPIDLKMDPLF